MEAFYRPVSRGNQSAIHRGSKLNPYFSFNGTVDVNSRPQQVSASRILPRSQQINPEFSEPFDLNADYLQREMAAPLRSYKTQDDFRKRQQPLGCGESFENQRQYGPFFLPKVGEKYSHEILHQNYSINHKETHIDQRFTPEFNYSVFENEKKSNNKFIANNKNEEINKTPVTKSPVLKNLKVSSRQRYFIGSIDQVIRWFRLTKQANITAIFEISAILESVQQGKASNRYVLFLRNGNGFNSSVLQAVYFCIDRDLPKLQTGQLVVCVGRMIGANKLQVLDIWQSTLEEQGGIKRLSFLCQRTLQEATLPSSDSQ